MTGCIGHFIWSMEYCKKNYIGPPGFIFKLFIVILFSVYLLSLLHLSILIFSVALLESSRRRVHNKLHCCDEWKVSGSIKKGIDQGF